MIFGAFTVHADAWVFDTEDTLLVSGLGFLCSRSCQLVPCSYSEGYISWCVSKFFLGGTGGKVSGMLQKPQSSHFVEENSWSCVCVNVVTSSVCTCASCRKHPLFILQSAICDTCLLWLQLFSINVGRCGIMVPDLCVCMFGCRTSLWHGWPQWWAEATKIGPQLLSSRHVLHAIPLTYTMKHVPLLPDGVNIYFAKPCN